MIVCLRLFSWRFNIQAFLVFIIGIRFVGLPPAFAIELSDTPMLSRVYPPPANIMFVLDDSASMNYEILVKGEHEGTFPNPDKPVLELNNDPHGYSYLFDDMGDNVYSYSAKPNWYAGPEGRKYWKLQWFKTNLIYYNPDITYHPWPIVGGTAFSNADPDKPRSHPVNNSSYSLDLRETSFSIGGINIPHAHYFVFSPKKAKPYLVSIDASSSSVQYYEVTVSGKGLAEKVTELIIDSNPPADVKSKRHFSAEKQNFANWFTYFRRREFVAKNAIGNLVKDLSEVRIGIYGINQKIVVALEPVNVTRGNSITDHSNLIMEKLYSYRSEGGTPLKKGLNTVGAFFKTNTGRIAGVTGHKPYDESELGAACQQSFSILLTDGYYSDFDFTPSGIGNADGDNGHPYADSSSNTLADISMFYYENDLNSLPDRFPTNRYDRAAHQHVVTCAIAFGVSGTLDPDDYDSDFRHKENNQIIQWPAIPDKYCPEAIDDLWHATVNGRGQFLNANSPQELSESINDLKNAIKDHVVGSAASVVFNGDSLYGKIGAVTYGYRSIYIYKDGEWTGDIEAFRVDLKTGNVLSKTPIWSAAQRLKNKDWDQRLIATFNEIEGKPFRPEELSEKQLNAIGTEPDKKVLYLRGAEIPAYRPRSQKLGDIVNSAPVFIAEGAEGIIYCGANDGMLHAFDASTGEELFAFIPNLVFDKLKNLTDPAYRHQFYVNLTPTVKRDLGILGTTGLNTLLVGGLGKGGKGYFALDVTNAKSISSEAGLARRVLWEFPKTTDPDMGYSFSKPVIVKSNSSAFPWVVIFGNGYNSTSGKSVLYVLTPDDGSEIKKIEADNGPDNGLSSPVAVDVTYDGTVDFIYAGDLKGKLWKFDLCSGNIADWKVAFSDGATVQPLFQAMGPGKSVQPITTKPDVMYHPEKHGFLVCFATGKLLGDGDVKDTSIQSIYGIWDYGDRVYNLNSKKWTADDDREYVGFFDREGLRNLSNLPPKVSLLKQTQKVLKIKTGNLERNYRIASNFKPIWLSKNDSGNRQMPDPSDAWDNHAGYYIDLEKGERVISDIGIRGGHLNAVGFTPGRDPCDPDGASIFMDLNAFTGGGVGESLFDINGDQRIDRGDLVRVDLDGDSIFEELHPSGIEFSGNLQLPAFLRPNDGITEYVLMSSSTGQLETLTAIGPKLGVTYWMEIHY
jgi:type IV pilus assembly protein PilY1